jgi:deaminated glutathione amidase
VRIALAQIVSTPSPAENLDLVAAQAEAAAAQGARIVVFPEATMCCFGVRLGPVAEPLDGPWAGRVREIAARTGLTIVAGMFTPDPDGRVRNTLLATGGGVEAHYDKIHLFDAFGFAESDTVAPGSEIATITVDGATVGLATCYDLRFPGLFQKLGDTGARLVLTPASWGAGPGKRAQWDLLVRARALDSTCFVAACDQADPATVGRDRGKAPTGIGAGLVASPYGEIVAQLGEEPGLLVTDVDLDLVDAARAAIPVLANRRF